MGEGTGIGRRGERAISIAVLVIPVLLSAITFGCTDELSAEIAPLRAEAVTAYPGFTIVEARTYNNRAAGMDNVFFLVRNKEHGIYSQIRFSRVNGPGPWHMTPNVFTGGVTRESAALASALRAREATAQVMTAAVDERTGIWTVTLSPLRGWDPTTHARTSWQRWRLRDTNGEPTWTRLSS